MCAVEQVSSCLERVMASDYITVRPVLAESVPEAEDSAVHVPQDGYHNQAADSHPSRSERPVSQVGITQASFCKASYHS